MLIKGYAKISCLSTRIPGEREMKKKKPLNPRKKPVQKRSQETVAAILEAAAQVFSRNGYAATTTDHIAHRAGVSIGSLYQYFPNKDAILLGLVERHIEESQAFVAEKREEIKRTGPAGPEMISRLVEAAIALHSLDPALHRVLFEEAPQFRAQQVEARIPGRHELLRRTGRLAENVCRLHASPGEERIDEIHGFKVDPIAQVGVTVAINEAFLTPGHDPVARIPALEYLDQLMVCGALFQNNAAR